MPDPTLLGAVLLLLGATFLFWLATRKKANWVLCYGPDIPCAYCQVCRRIFPLPLQVVSGGDEGEIQEIRCYACSSSRWSFIFVRPVHRIWRSLLGLAPVLPTGADFDPHMLGIPLAVPVQSTFFYNPHVPMGDA